MGVEDEDYTGYVSKPNRRGTQQRGEDNVSSNNFKLEGYMPDKIFETRKRHDFNRGSGKRRK